MGRGRRRARRGRARDARSRARERSHRRALDGRRLPAPGARRQRRVGPARGALDEPRRGAVRQLVLRGAHRHPHHRGQPRLDLAGGLRRHRGHHEPADRRRARPAARERDPPARGRAAVRAGADRPGADRPRAARPRRRRGGRARPGRRALRVRPRRAGGRAGPRGRRVARHALAARVHGPAGRGGAAARADGGGPGAAGGGGALGPAGPRGGGRRPGRRRGGARAPVRDRPRGRGPAPQRRAEDGPPPRGVPRVPHAADGHPHRRPRGRGRPVRAGRRRSCSRR